MNAKTPKEKKEKVNPHKRRILVKLVDVRKQESGLELPHTWRIWQCGEVQAVGSQVDSIEVGDVVYFRRFTPYSSDSVITHEDNVLLKNELGDTEPKYIYTIKSARDAPKTY